MAWTEFWDMSSGGERKIPGVRLVYIEAPEEAAIAAFVRIFDLNPHNVTCSYCGSDFVTSESATIEQATGYHRRCAHDENGLYVEHPRRGLDLIPIAVFETMPDVRVIRAADIPQ